MASKESSESIRPPTRRGSSPTVREGLSASRSCGQAPQLLKYQPAENLRHVKGGFLCACRLPREIAASRIRSHTAKQVSAPALTALRLMNPMVPWNAHPNNYSIPLDMRGCGQVRLKLPI